MTTEPFYFTRRQRDGTFHVYRTKGYLLGTGHGELVRAWVRPCNVRRVVAALERRDFARSQR